MTDSIRPPYANGRGGFAVAQTAKLEGPVSDYEQPFGRHGPGVRNWREAE